MRNLLPRSAAFRALALSLPVAAIGLAVFASPIAGATVLTGVTDTISIVEEKGNLKFEFPSTVVQGDQLEIVNETNPKKVGPHTFSLVTQGSVPKTKNQRHNCFTPKHVCFSIAKWHGLNAKEEVTINPAEAGPEGWSTMGSVSKKGDSWFTQKQGDAFSQQVTAKPGTLYFICAVHSWMHGKVTVLPSATS
ncbi:MAG: cupredoxin domain-containing protein [Solirubrobacterales bacterium]